MKRFFKMPCTACEGRGTILFAIYRGGDGVWEEADSIENCPSCHAKGFVFVPTQDPAVTHVNH